MARESECFAGDRWLAIIALLGCSMATVDPGQLVRRRLMITVRPCGCVPWISLRPLQQSCRRQAGRTSGLLSRSSLQSASPARSATGARAEENKHARRKGAYSRSYESCRFLVPAFEHCGTSCSVRRRSRVARFDRNWCGALKLRVIANSGPLCAANLSPETGR